MPQTVTPQTKFEPVPRWAKVPHGITFRGDATSVAVDSKDNVYVFSRGNVPVTIFDSDGNYLGGWGEGEFIRPHGIFIDHNDEVYLIDDFGHIVQKRSLQGDIKWTLGELGKGAEWQGGEPFNRPTDATVSPTTGDVFISDGYGNSRVHRYDASGKHILSWGEPGTDPGQFSLPHNITMWGDDKVVVADRENFRLQIFTIDGEFVDQWHIYHPMSVLRGRGDDTAFYVGEMGPPPVQDGVPGLGFKVSMWDESGNHIQSIGADLPGQDADQFCGPHGMAIDSKGNIYVAEVSWTFYYSKRDNPPLGEIVSLRKWARTSG
ncbi:MAG: peptidylglycine alpha-amidating monooxygenase [Chloroflexi bacterium]|nr:peptidylglycine alpha-amidating monooxygenase [Chloroflexota bacterium]